MKKELLNNTWNQPSKFKTKHWVEINDDSHGTYSTNSQNRSKTCVEVKLCDYSDSYMLVNGNITVTGGPEDPTPANKKTDKSNKRLIKTVHHLLNAQARKIIWK